MTTTATSASASAESYCVLSLGEIRNLLRIAEEAADIRRTSLRLVHGKAARNWSADTTCVVLRGRCDALPEDHGKVQVRLATANGEPLL